MNAVIRHGSRYPTDGDMESILHVAELVDSYSSLITNASFAWIKQWRDPYDLINAGILSYAGEMEVCR